MTSQFPFFTKDEYDQRLRSVRKSLLHQNLEACLVSVPESIYYLSGINHWGFFAYHILIVTPENQMVLIARAMEQETMDRQLMNARFVGYGDLDDPSQATLAVLKKEGLETGKLGIEKNSLYFPIAIAEKIRQGLPNVEWIDASDLIFQHRMKLSISEIKYIRKAAAITDVMMRTAIETAAAGVTEKEVAAEVHRAMILAGGEYPAFGPFIRSTPTLALEHSTWTDRPLEFGDVLFVELAGCAGRYHAPMGRLIFIGKTPPGTKEIERICLEAFNNITTAIRPGVTAHEVYQAWQDRVDAAGLAHYRRHHCGYMVGSAFPPAWSGGGIPRGLRRDSNLELRAGMAFHLMSWLMHTGREGDYFVSNTALVSEHGCEVLTTTPQHVHIV
jgi:Xaa-Pro dipeptidase